jgi:hypothetical protein
MIENAFFLTHFDEWVHFVLIFDLYLWENNPFMFQQFFLFQFKRHWYLMTVIVKILAHGLK